MRRYTLPSLATSNATVFPDDAEPSSVFKESLPGISHEEADELRRVTWGADHRHFNEELDPHNRKKYNSFARTSGSVTCVTFSLDGTRMAAGHKDNSAAAHDITVWSLVGAVVQSEEWNMSRTFKDEKLQGKVEMLAFSPDGRLLASGPGSVKYSERLFKPCCIVIWNEVQPGQFASDGTVVGMQWQALWELDFGKDNASLSFMSFWRSSRWLTLAYNSGDGIGHVELWDVENQSLYHSLDDSTPASRRLLEPPRKVDSCAYAPDFTHLIVGSTNVETQKRFVSTLAIDVDAWCSCQETMLWQPPKGREVAVTVAWSSDGRWVAAVGGHELLIWSASSILQRGDQFVPPIRRLSRESQVDKMRVQRIAFSSDGCSIAAGGKHDSVVTLWDIETGGISRQWYCPDDLTSLEFAPRADIIAGAAGAEPHVMLLHLGGSAREREIFLDSSRDMDSDQTESVHAAMSKDCSYLGIAEKTSNGIQSTIINLHNGQNPLEENRVIPCDDVSDILDIAICVCSLDVKIGRHAKSSACQGAVRRYLALLTTFEQGLKVWTFSEDTESRLELPVRDELYRPVCMKFSNDGDHLIVASRGPALAGNHKDCHYIVMLSLVDAKHVAELQAVHELRDEEPSAMAITEKLNLVVVACSRSIISFQMQPRSQHGSKTEDTEGNLVQKSTISIQLSVQEMACFENSFGEIPVLLVAGYTSNGRLHVWQHAYDSRTASDEAEISLFDSSRRAREFAEQNMKNAKDPNALARCRSGAIKHTEFHEEKKRRGVTHLKFHAVANGNLCLAFSCDGRLSVWVSAMSRQGWHLSVDLRFSGDVISFEFDDRAEVANDPRPRSVVVRMHGHRSKQDIDYDDDGTTTCLVYDLHEYSLSFHLPDIKKLFKHFGEDAVSARFAACPGLLHQRLFSRQLGWTLFHWAAFKGSEELVRALLTDWQKNKDGASPFALDSIGRYSAVDLALRYRYYGIIEDFLEGAIAESSMLRHEHLLPDSHIALTKTVVALIRHQVPSLPTFLDCACLQKPVMINNEPPPTKATRTESRSVRTTTCMASVVSRDDMNEIVPAAMTSTDFEQPISVKILLLRGVLDKDLGFIKALKDAEQADVLTTQAVKMVLHHKWASARSPFIRELLAYIVYIVIFFIWSNYYYRSQERFHPGVALDFTSDEIDENLWTSFVKRSKHPYYLVMQLLLLLLTVYFLYGEFVMLFREVGDASTVDGMPFSCLGRIAQGLNMYFSDPWNFIDVARTLAMFYIILFDRASRLEVVAVTTLIMWVRLLYYCRGSKSTAALVRILTQTILDMSAFLFVCSVFWLAFSHAFFIMMREEPIIELDVENVSFFDALVFTYRLVFLGESDISAELQPIVTQLLFLSSTFISNVVAMNMLIAVMQDTYNSVQDAAITAANMEISKLVYEHETLFVFGSAAREYLLASFKENRPPPVMKLASEAGMDKAELRMSERALEKEQRRHDHLTLVQVDHKMSQVLKAEKTMGPRLKAVIQQVNTLESLFYKFKGDTERTIQKLLHEGSEKLGEQLSARSSHSSPPSRMQTKMTSTVSDGAK